MRRAWKAAVPAAFLLLAGMLPAAAQDRATVLIPSRVIYPGETIEPSALREVTLRPGAVAPAGVAVSQADLDGKVARRTLLPGRYVAATSIREPYVVEQGAAVRVEFIAGGLKISARGVTLQPGSAGDLVRVRNIDSGKILSGVVMMDGSIRVGAT